MGAVLDLNRLRRTRRFPAIPGLDTDHYGTGAVDEGALRPRVFSVPDWTAPAQPQPDNLYPLDAPSRQIFSEGTPAPTLQPPAAPPRRQFSFTPAAEEMPTEALTPINSPALRRFTRPTFQDTGDQATDLQRYGQTLSEWRDPADRNGRLKSIGLGALRGLMRGLSTGQGLGAGLGGAVAGAVHGGVAPNLDERQWRDEETARTQGQLGALQERRVAALKLRGLEADVAKTEAERQALLNPKPKEPKLFQGADGLQYEYDPQTKTAQAIPGQGGKPSVSKVLRTTVRGGKVWYETEEGLKPALDPDTGEQLAEPMREITLNGQTFNVSESEAARILGGVEAANVAAGNQYGKETHEETVRRLTKEHEEKVRLWEALGPAQNELIKAITSMNEAIAQREAATSAEDKAAWEAAAKTRKENVETLAGALGPYAEFVETDARGWPTRRKPRPAAPALPSQPAPQRRSAGASPRRGAPKAPPVSEEEFLSRARQQMGAAFDETRARAAYRQRYGR